MNETRLDALSFAAVNADQTGARLKNLLRQPKKPDVLPEPEWWAEELASANYDPEKPLPMKVRRSELALQAHSVLTQALSGEEPLALESHKWLIAVLAFFAYYPSGTTEDGAYDLMGLEDWRGRF